MPRSTKRASTRDLDILHRLTVKSLVAEMRRLRRAKEAVPPALLTASIKLLSVTGSTAPALPTQRDDPRADLLKEYQDTEEAERRERGAVDFSQQ